MFKRLKEEQNIKVLIAIVLIMAIIWLFTQISGTILPVVSGFLLKIMPFILGMIFAVLLNPIVQNIANSFFKGKKSLGILVVFVVIITILIFVIYPIVRDFVANFSEIINYLRNATSLLLDSVGTLNSNFKEQVLGYISTFGSNITKTLLDSVNNVVNASMQTFLTLIITAFALLEYDYLIKKFTLLFKKEKRTIVIEYILGLEKQLYFYLRSLLISFLVSVVVFGVVLYMLNINNAWSFAIIMSLFIVLIPVIGPFIATGILAVITIPIGTIPTLIGFIGLFIFMQLFINIISPRIYAETLDLSNLLIIVSFMVGNALLGIMGALFAIPALLVLVYTYKFLEKHKYWSERE